MINIVAARILEIVFMQDFEFVFFRIDGAVGFARSGVGENREVASHLGQHLGFFGRGFLWTDRLGDDPDAEVARASGGGFVNTREAFFRCRVAEVDFFSVGQQLLVAKNGFAIGAAGIGNF